MTGNLGPKTEETTKQQFPEASVAVHHTWNRSDFVWGCFIFL